jgi:RNA recognition motif-containing protein
MNKTELYVGNLSRDVTQEEIENVFQKHGKIVRCDMKNKGYGPAYAFIEFDDERDAEVCFLTFVLFEGFWFGKTKHVARWCLYFAS